jgi:hypothetical protein
MGRELKRVPLDFKWPIDQIWKGYINPYRSQECKPCVVVAKIQKQKSFLTNGEARAKHLGVYGDCEYCDGEGEIWQSEEIKELSQNWEWFHPPVGDGFQLWTTTNEGSPMTPVFNTLEALCEYCENENVSVFGSSTATKERWMQMLGQDFVAHQEGNMIFL